MREYRKNHKNKAPNTDFCGIIEHSGAKVISLGGYGVPIVCMRSEREDERLLPNVFENNGGCLDCLLLSRDIC